MPYIENKNNRREYMDDIVKLIGELDILGDKITSRNKIQKIVKLMIDYNIKINGDLNYILYAVCKRYVKPSYNNYKKYLTKLVYMNHNLKISGDLSQVLYELVSEYNMDNNNFIGELDCCAREIYRRIIVPYENQKIKENGDVE